MRTVLDGLPPGTIVRDQRTMIGVRVHETVEDVRAAWDEWRDMNGFPMRKRSGDFDLSWRHSLLVLRAYVSGGAWHADCPECKDACAGWPENDEGACLGCGTIYKLSFPPPKQIEEAYEALRHRPLLLRSWHPHEGVTPADLALENVKNGWPVGERSTSDQALEVSLREVLAPSEAERALNVLRREGLLT